MSPYNSGLVFVEKCMYLKCALVCFQVSLFAELFNEMLMRDSGFLIYKALMAAPEKPKEEKKDKKDKDKDKDKKDDKKDDKDDKKDKDKDDKDKDDKDKKDEDVSFFF